MVLIYEIQIFQLRSQGPYSSLPHSTDFRWQSGIQATHTSNVCMKNVKWTPDALPPTSAKLHLTMYVIIFPQSKCILAINYWQLLQTVKHGLHFFHISWYQFNETTQSTLHYLCKTNGIFPINFRREKPCYVKTSSADSEKNASLL